MRKAYIYHDLQAVNLKKEKLYYLHNLLHSWDKDKYFWEDIISLDAMIISLGSNERIVQ